MDPCGHNNNDFGQAGAYNGSSSPIKFWRRGSLSAAPALPMRVALQPLIADFNDTDGGGCGHGSQTSHVYH
ncbi:hypothetical protein SNOG_03419 [Parastagonospora nodorum SN15]|uniref:Uncharacterized protein n=1 Tax=Phaeosphaeria nodorum (strain SN15 / ATCC MYA-4574 / FGSC 10173) TaxID=321614 RepID=Q0UXU5_PHANO|nr:hypothetical protein SNOG_03419 [Parastagonospora nodorum SN15]EAT88624.1 hypothetical protein SNOG_03419 [Parastagonospora nodorum SN15]